MKEKIIGFLTCISLVLLIPYIITILVNGVDTVLLNRPMDLEDCLPGIVSAQITSDYELETVKCQAVIARTNLFRKVNNEDSFSGVLEVLQQYVEAENIDFFQIFSDNIYEKAVEQTEGRVLLYQDELKLVPYHEISSGQTRDGEEAFHEEEYSYLVSVDSSQDKKSLNYLNSTYFSQQQMPKKLEIEIRDSAGYVESLLADGSVLEGEAFRQGMGLASADFTIQKVGEEYRFLCKGRGHGIGFSQYGGNELAKEGSSCEEILLTYFPLMKVGYLDE